MAFDRSEKLAKLREARKYWADVSDQLMEEVMSIHGGISTNRASQVTAIEAFLARKEIAHGGSLAGGLDEHPTD
mgnify:CR=1 FL=1